MPPVRKEEELYRVQLAQQEQREQGLVLENTKLRQLLDQVCQDVQQLLGTDIGVAQVRAPWEFLLAAVSA